MLVGIDFDNTIIRYDDLFHKIASEKSLIQEDVLAKKNVVRDHLRKNGLEFEWTLMQGEAYGNRIEEAKPFKGMFETLKYVQANGVDLVLVSHKTRIPFIGPQYDLHKAAWSWLRKQGFFEPNGLNWKQDQVYFELTKEDKVKRILSLGCTHFVDDLPEILEMLPNKIHRILFKHQHGKNESDLWPLMMNSWKELPLFLN